MKLQKKVRIFDEKLNNTSPKLFEDTSGIVFWDDISNQAYYDLYQIQTENFWIPNEVSMAQDVSQWVSGKLSHEEKELYKSGIGVLAGLDSIATVFDKVASDYIGDSAVKAIMAFIAAMETIHNASYTYTFSSLSTKEEAKEVFERAKKNPFVVKRNKTMIKCFNDFLEKRDIPTFLKALVAMSGLEGVCFVNGFTPFYHLNRNGKMFGTGKIIKFIQRDEVQHSYFQTLLVRHILTEYPEYNTEEFSQWIYDFFEELVLLEQEYCIDLYKDIEDIDMEEVNLYVGFRANIILDNLGLEKIFPAKKNPMPWITAFDPANSNRVKTDFFEDEEDNYSLTSEDKNEWDDL